MDVNDRHQDGPEEQPTEPTAEQPPSEGPQAPAEPGPKPGTSPQRRLTRSRTDRVLGGVCGGLGRYFNVDPILFRIGTVALTLVGGAGALLYLAALLLVPNEEPGGATAPPTQGRNRALVIAGVVALLLIASPFLVGGGLLLAGIGIPLALLVGAGVLVWWLVSGEGPSGDAGDIVKRAALGIGVLALCVVVALGGAFAAAAGPDWLVPTLVVLAGGAILAGAFMRPIRWLVLPAVALALAAGTVAAAGVDLDGGVGEREYRPGTAADLRDRYELGIGHLVVDLRETDLPKGDVPLDVDLGMGEALVVVPDDVCVATDADVGMGNVSAFGSDHGGIDVDYEDAPRSEPATTRLLLSGQVGIGELRVSHDRTDYDDYRFGDFDVDADDARAQTEACDAG